MLELQDICYQVTEDSQDIDILRDVSLKIDDEFTGNYGAKRRREVHDGQDYHGNREAHVRQDSAGRLRTLRSCPSRSAPERESASRSSSRSVSRG